MSGKSALVLTQGATSRAVTARHVVAGIQTRGWLDAAVERVVVQIGAAGRSELAVETAAALADALRGRVPSIQLDVLDPGGRPGAARGMRRIAVDPDEAVEVVSLGGVALRVPSLWFDPFFLVTIAGVHGDRRWRVGAVLEVQAETLARLNPGVPGKVLLPEAHRLGGADLAIACATHPTAGEWWAASPSDVLVEAIVARASGIDPREHPGIRAVACHELLEPWDAMPEAPPLSDVAFGAWSGAMLAAREQGGAAARRTVEDAGRVSRNLRKVPQALRRRLAARAGGRKSA